jgi:hypothetical protein
LGVALLNYLFSMQPRLPNNFPCLYSLSFVSKVLLKKSSPKTAYKVNNLLLLGSVSQPVSKVSFGGNLCSGQKVIVKRKTPLWNLFKIYLKLNVLVYTSGFKPHPSWNSLYLLSHRGGSTLVSVKHFFLQWTNFYFLLDNLMFFNFNPAFFGTPFFKYEVLASNQKNLKTLNIHYRLKNPLIFFIQNKISTVNKFFFNKLFFIWLQEQFSFWYLIP